ncbi:MAG: hypothetical protein ACSLE3_10860 [Microbacteriaceae bacterium]
MSALTFNPIKSKTVWGLLVVVIGYLLQPDVLAILPEQIAEFLRVIGGLLAALGLRDAATQRTVPAPATAKSEAEDAAA